MTRFLMFAGSQSEEQLDFTALVSTMSPQAITGRDLLGMPKYDGTGVLTDIKIPTFIIGAAADHFTKLEASEYTHEQISESVLLTLSPADHMGFVERHREVNLGVGDYLDTLNK